jgi:ribosomal protein S27E
MARERARPRAPLFIDPPGYARHRPEATPLYQIVQQHYPEFVAAREAAGRPLPNYVQEEFEAYLKCGRLEHGFLRVRCEDCHAEKLVAFSCKRRGFCPSCGARRMTDGAALLADEVLPTKPIRQWVLSLPFALRFLLATDPDALTQVLGIVYRTISAYVLKRARLTRARSSSAPSTVDPNPPNLSRFPMDRTSPRLKPQLELTAVGRTHRPRTRTPRRLGPRCRKQLCRARRRSRRADG